MKIARDLLKVYRFDRLVDLLNQFFATDDGWFARCGYSLPCFKNSISKLLLRERRAITPTKSSPGETQPRVYTGWQRAADITQGPTPEN